MFHLKSFTQGASVCAIIGVVAVAAVAQVAPPPPPGGTPALAGPVGNHWACYRISSPVAMPPEAITMTDQFGKAEIVLGQPVMLCNPSAKVHKNQKFDYTQPDVHLVCYQIVKQLAAANHTLKIGNQFQNSNVQQGARTHFCAPSYKKIIGD